MVGNGRIIIRVHFLYYNVRLDLFSHNSWDPLQLVAWTARNKNFCSGFYYVKPPERVVKLFLQTATVLEDTADELIIIILWNEICLIL